MMVLLYIWQCSQVYISENKVNTDDNGMGDRLLHNGITDQIHAVLTSENGTLAKLLLIVSSFLIDVHTVHLFLDRSHLRFLICGMFLRQLCQYFTALPLIPGQYWEHPGFPSVFVIYGVGNDYFFSGHTYLAMCATGLLFQSKKRSTRIYAFLFALLEISTVVVLKGHYFMDIYTAIMTYFALRFISDIEI